MSMILFTGGGTLGPVTPLLAVLDRLREENPEYSFLWVGTDSGPERILVESKQIPFITLPEAKLPRYLSRKLLTAPFDFLRARKAARNVLEQYHPRVIVSAGGFTAVPLVQEAHYHRIPCISHQLDATPGLSNRLIAKQSRYVTLSFAYDHPPFKTTASMYQIPTPVRFRLENLPSRESACHVFDLDPDPQRKVLLIVGGGTGAMALNEAMSDIIDQLPPQIQIIHVTGKGKELEKYHGNRLVRRYAFLKEEMFSALVAADLVISRSGIGAISELAALAKPTIFVPLPHSPQERNVECLGKDILSVDQQASDFKEKLQKQIEECLSDDALCLRLGNALHDVFPTDDGSALAHLVKSVIV